MSLTSLQQVSLSASTFNSAPFLVCGLGSLGQFCVFVLKEFGVPVRAITLTQPLGWEMTNLSDQLDYLLVGDCRQPDLLQKAGVETCRAVLLVSSDERVNIEAAFAVRLLNPTVRLVVRSAKTNLNELVGDRLGNFVAFEATQLPAPAFAIAALDSEICGFIKLDNSMLRVVKTSVTRDHRWCDRRTVYELNTQTRRVISHVPYNAPSPEDFHQWNPDAVIQAGDTVAYIEVTESQSVQPLQLLQAQSSSNGKNQWQHLRQSLTPAACKRRLLTLWRSTADQQSKRVALLVGIGVLTLVSVGTVTFLVTQPNVSPLQAFYVSAVMLLGSYDTVYGEFSVDDTVPVWMRLMNLTYMLAGTASIAVLYALLTETLLAAKFQLPRKRPPVPTEQHVVVMGLGRVGRQVADFLQQIKQSVVGVNVNSLESSVLPQLPVIVGDLAANLSKTNLTGAKSVVLATDDEMANLELALLAHRMNPNCGLVIRTFDPTFSGNIDRLLPYAKVLCAYDLAAEAFVAAAFGENILNLLRLNNQTVLTTEYRIEARDTLCGRLLSEIAYGYGVMPILHERSGKPARLMPSEDTRLEVDDQLIVLATIEGLQRVESGKLKEQTWLVRIEKVLSQDAAFEAANAIVRVSDCGIQLARDVMNQLPATLPVPLYYYQALRLVRELTKAQAIAQLISTSE